MDDCRGRKAKMKGDTPEITNLFRDDSVVILDEKLEGEEPFIIKKFLVRSLIREEVKGWVNASDVSNETLW